MIRPVFFAMHYRVLVIIAIACSLAFITGCSGDSSDSSAAATAAPVAATTAPVAATTAPVAATAAPAAATAAPAAVTTAPAVATAAPAAATTAPAVATAAPAAATTAPAVATTAPAVATTAPAAATTAPAAATTAPAAVTTAPAVATTAPSLTASIPAAKKVAPPTVTTTTTGPKYVFTDVSAPTSVSIPDGALPSGVTIVPELWEEKRTDPDSGVVITEKVFKFGSEHVELSKPAQIEFEVPKEMNLLLVRSVDDAGNPIAGASAPTITRSTTSSGTTTVTAEVDHFSNYVFTHTTWNIVRGDEQDIAEYFNISDISQTSYQSKVGETVEIPLAANTVPPGLGTYKNGLDVSVQSWSFWHNHIIIGSKSAVHTDYGDSDPHLRAWVTGHRTNFEWLRSWEIVFAYDMPVTNSSLHIECVKPGNHEFELEFQSEIMMHGEQLEEFQAGQSFIALFNSDSLLLSPKNPSSKHQHLYLSYKRVSEMSINCAKIEEAPKVCTGQIPHVVYGVGAIAGSTIEIYLANSPTAQSSARSVTSVVVGSDGSWGPVNLDDGCAGQTILFKVDGEWMSQSDAWSAGGVPPDPVGGYQLTP
jgi:hypothetical protein